MPDSSLWQLKSPDWAALGASAANCLPDIRAQQKLHLSLVPKNPTEATVYRPCLQGSPCTGGRPACHSQPTEAAAAAAARREDELAPPGSLRATRNSTHAQGRAEQTATFSAMPRRATVGNGSSCFPPSPFPQHFYQPLSNRALLTVSGHLETGSIMAHTHRSWKTAPKKRPQRSTFSISVGSGISGAEKCTSAAIAQTACCSAALQEAAFYKGETRAIIPFVRSDGATSC